MFEFVDSIWYQMIVDRKRSGGTFSKMEIQRAMYQVRCVTLRWAASRCIVLRCAWLRPLGSA